MNFISVDGGATKTVAIAYDESGIMGVGLAGSTNFRNVGWKNFKANLTRSVKDAKEMSGYESVDKMTFALAGIKDSERSTQLIRDMIYGIFEERNISLYNDGEAGFYSRFLNDNGIIVAPGTGMISYGRLGSKTVRSSGWGWFLDDEGGAFSIGKRLLQEVVKISDLRSDIDSELVDKVRDYFKLNNDREIINAIYKHKIDIREIASLARFVSDAAKNGDLLGNKLMNEAAKETATAAYATFQKLGSPSNIKISGYGGVLRAGDWYWDLISTYIREKIQDPIIIEPFYGYEAVIGSVILNYMENGLEVNNQLLYELRSQLNSKILEIPTSRRENFLFF